jgi:hypothetical protein
MIGNGDAVGVAGQVAQDVLGSTEGRLEVDHPVLPEQGAQEGGEPLRLTEGLERAGGLSPDHLRWIHPRYHFLLPRHVLSRAPEDRL